MIFRLKTKDMKTKDFSRRKFIATTASTTAAVAVSASIPAFGSITPVRNESEKLAILGGTPVAPDKKWPDWPYIDEKVVEEVVKTTRSGIWCRIQSPNGTVPTFEKELAKVYGIKNTVSTGSGTQALNTVVEALELGPGDEIITSPYTDPGTIQSILVSRALPVMADLDTESFQLDPDDVERKITKNTKALMPVHMMGQPCNMQRIMEIAKKHNLRVIEDSCQAIMAEYQGKKVGLIGDAGCLSFQTSKVFCCGEGGAIFSNNDELLEKCYTVMNHGTAKNGRTTVIGSKYRMNEFEGAVLLGQMPGLKERHDTRNRNAKYLTENLKDIQGLVPQKLYEGTTQGSWYIYAWSYKKEYWNNAPREKFLKALSAEGINLSPYIANGLHKEPWTEFIQTLPEYRTMFGTARMKKFRDELNLSKCDQVCQDMVMLWASGPLTGTLADMDDVIKAIKKVYANRDKLNSI